MTNEKTVNILGIRGIPAAHGGFETFAGHLAPYLRDKGWSVNVYCQLEPDEDGVLRSDYDDDWNGIRRIHLGTKRSGSLGSIIFDWRCIRHAACRPGVNLILGYNTAIFSLWLRLRGRPVVMNMDGIEWKRAKWSWPVKAWFYLNEFIGANFSTLPIADHPQIANHLRRHGCTRSVVIPYGANHISHSPDDAIVAMGLNSKEYVISIARIEPENSILEIVEAYSSEKRSINLVILGKLDEKNQYHRKIKSAASEQVVFLGAIYDKTLVSALRFHSLAYLHGHQVGGTNPSLVEAMGAGSAVIAHDNRFNRWVAGEDQYYFNNTATLAKLITQLSQGKLPIEQSAMASSKRFDAEFTLEIVNERYETILSQFDK